MAGTASAGKSARLSAGCDVPKDSQHRSFALLRRRSRVPNRLRRPSHLAAPTSRKHGEFVVVQDVLNPTTEHRSVVLIAILLDNAIKMGLLRTDHIQYLSLKWGLLQAFGITHSEAKMTGEFAKLKD